MPQCPLDPPCSPPFPLMTIPALDTGLMWFRNDLRTTDNTALHHALTHCRRVHAVYVFEPPAAAPTTRPLSDRSAEFLLRSLESLDGALGALSRQAGAMDADGVHLLWTHGSAERAVTALARRLGAEAVFANADADPEGSARDARVRGALADAGVSLHLAQDHLLFGPDDLHMPGGTLPAGFAAYYRQWLGRIDAETLRPHPVAPHARALAPAPAALRRPLPSLEAIGHAPSNLAALPLFPGMDGARRQWDEFLPRMPHYHLAHDYPGVRGPSYLGVHLRFGTLGIRDVAASAWALHRQGHEGASLWLERLAWRDFFAQALAHHPHAIDRPFRGGRDPVRWDRSAHGRKLYAAWCEGRTGYPLVDAAMRQLVQSGYMHHRLRMVSACFLTRYLGVDWRWGERFFAQHLNDLERASNNAGWQWAAGTGCEALPWYRTLNPVRQGQRYDPQGRFLRRYLPEIAALPDGLLQFPARATAADWRAAGLTPSCYPAPLVDLAEGRRLVQQRLVQHHPQQRSRRARR